MQIADFAFERYFAQHEFTTRYPLCASDVEAYATDGIPLAISVAGPRCGHFPFR